MESFLYSNSKHLKLPLPRYNFKKDTTIMPLSFLERIALIDFDKVYSKRVRIFCHCFMWALFTSLTFINLRFDYKFSLETSLLFTLRNLICNAAVFYFFFYLVVSFFLLKNRIVLTLISLPVLLILWVVINHYFMVVMEKYYITNDTYWKNFIIANAKSTLLEIISLKHIGVVSIEVIYAISPFFFTKIVFDIIRFYSKLFKTQRKASQLEIEKQQLETNFLKAQLNPHFLFNTLNNLYGLSLRNDNQTPQTIMQLSAMMRYTLYECNTEMVCLSKEIEFLKNYVSLEKMRYKADKEIVFNIDDSQVSQQKIAPLLNFTFIENGFKYGLKNKDKGFLKIDMSVFNNNFYFSIINDKEDKPMEKKEFGGIGISNIRKRLELLYVGKYELINEDRGTSYFVSMKINLGEGKHGM